MAPKTEQEKLNAAAEAEAQAILDAEKAAEADNRRKAYALANTTLREKHRPEFERLYEAECNKLGVTYKRRLSDEEKAAKQVEELLIKHPSLRNQFAAGPSED